MNSPTNETALSRRRFLAAAGSVAAAATLAGCSDDGSVVITPPVSTVSDADILTFALNLEYLEANFYLYGATGAGLASSDVGTSAGAVTVPSTTKLSGLSTFQQNVLNELAYTEQEHVRFLRAQLTAAGVTPISMPAIDLMNSFNTLASAAGLGASFNPFANFDNFALAATIFEDIGVTAYNGAAPLISTSGIQKGYLSAAAGIMAVEAYHGATLRGYLYNQAATKGTSAYPQFAQFNAVQGVISTLSSGSGTLNLQIQGTTATTVATVGAANTVPNVVPADSNALAFHRTTDQVLHIAYGKLSNSSPTSGSSASGVASGGFFPSGFNGNIKTTQS